MQALSPFLRGEGQEENFNFKEALFAFWQHKWLVLNVIVIALTAVSIYAFHLPDIYEASTDLLIQDLPAPVTRSETEEIAFQNTNERYLRAQTSLLTSLPILKAVAEQPGLQEKLAATSTTRPSTEVIALKLKKMITVTAKDLIFTITVKNQDPFLAAGIANALAKLYVKQYLEGRLYLSKEIIEIFPDEAKELKRHTSRGKLEELSRRDLIMKLPSVSSNQAVKALQEKKYLIESQMQTLSQRYKEKHPKMIELQTNLSFVEERLNAVIEGIVSGLKEKLVTKFQAENVKIVAAASIPKTPSGPKRIRIIVFAGLLSLALSLGLVLMFDVLDDRLNNEDDLERFVQLPFLGAIYLIKKVQDELKRSSYVLHEPLSETAEAFKLLRVNINFATAAEHRKTLLITSTVPQEGKTFVAANLAISKAQDDKKILLVDADLRRPQVHKVFGLSNKSGLSNILTTDTPFESVIQKTQLANLHVIASGPPSPNPPEIFGSEVMVRLLKDLEGKYDTVIFDAPPSFGIPDSLVLGSMVNATIFVVRAHQTSYKLINKAKKYLQEKNVRIIGAVLNNLEPSKGKSYYYDYKHYGYTYSHDKGGSKVPV